MILPFAAREPAYEAVTAEPSHPATDRRAL